MEMWSWKLKSTPIERRKQTIVTQNRKEEVDKAIADVDFANNRYQIEMDDQCRKNSTGLVARRCAWSLQEHDRPRAHRVLRRHHLSSGHTGVCDSGRMPNGNRIRRTQDTMWTPNSMSVSTNPACCRWPGRPIRTQPDRSFFFAWNGKWLPRWIATTPPLGVRPTRKASTSSRTIGSTPTDSNDRPKSEIRIESAQVLVHPNG